MNKHIQDYMEWRAIGVQLNTKLFGELNKDDIRIAARHLGLLTGNALLLDSEENIARLADFVINDVFDVNGDNAVTRYLKKNIDTMSKAEWRILVALATAKPSLYEVIDVDAESATIRLVDLINMGNEMEVIDRGFSATSMICNFLVFTRIIELDVVNLTSGAPLLFDGGKKRILLTSYGNTANKIPSENRQTRLAAAFNLLYKKHGHQSLQYR